MAPILPIPINPIASALTTVGPTAVQNFIASDPATLTALRAENSTFAQLSPGVKTLEQVTALAADATPHAKTFLSREVSREADELCLRPPPLTSGYPKVYFLPSFGALSGTALGSLAGAIGGILPGGHLMFAGGGWTVLLGCMGMFIGAFGGMYAGAFFGLCSGTIAGTTLALFTEVPYSSLRDLGSHKTALGTTGLAIAAAAAMMSGGMNLLPAVGLALAGYTGIGWTAKVGMTIKKWKTEQQLIAAERLTTDFLSNPGKLAEHFWNHPDALERLIGDWLPRHLRDQEASLKLDRDIIVRTSLGIEQDLARLPELTLDEISRLSIEVELEGSHRILTQRREDLDAHIADIGALGDRLPELAARLTAWNHARLDGSQNQAIGMIERARRAVGLANRADDTLDASRQMMDGILGDLQALMAGLQSHHEVQMEKAQAIAELEAKLLLR
ncbi:MAG: hypothetical protein HY540_00575 [Deltaproteobacteria bacterium]|nr:hypothetical protein [Deltaproteobacteria bacterium]